jgi:hypothetical protein
LTDRADKITVQIKYKDLQETISGNPEEVWLNVGRFFAQFLPSFEIARRLVLDVDLQRLVRETEGLIALASEGPYVLIPKNKITDNETLELLLLASYISNNLRGSEDGGVLKDELQTKLGKSSKIASTRLGELVKSEIATKTPDDRYKITTFGIFQMQKDVLPKIRAKIGV